jgi:hypothetical protein
MNIFEVKISKSLKDYTGHRKSPILFKFFFKKRYGTA